MPEDDGRVFDDRLGGLRDRETKPEGGKGFCEGSFR